MGGSPPSGVPGAIRPCVWAGRLRRGIACRSQDGRAAPYGGLPRSHRKQGRPPPRAGPARPPVGAWGAVGSQRCVSCLSLRVPSPLPPRLPPADRPVRPDDLRESHEGRYLLVDLRPVRKPCDRLLINLRSRSGRRRRPVRNVFLRSFFFYRFFFEYPIRTRGSSRSVPPPVPIRSEEHTSELQSR